MPIWKEFRNFKNYLDEFVKLTKISTRIGIFENERSTFSASYYFFKDFFQGEPVKPSSYESPVGKVTYSNVILDGDKIFDRKTKVNFLRQGDILDQNACNVIPDSSGWMVISATCNLEKSTSILLSPIYTLDFLFKNMRALNPKVKDNQQSINDSARAARDNKNTRFLGLPRCPELNNVNGIEVNPDFHIVDLNQIFTVPKDTVGIKKLKLGLTFEGVAYLQNRLAICHLRDLQFNRWDDERKLASEL